MAAFIARVFGKPGCDKCSVLKERLGKLLAEPAWNDFTMDDQDVMTDAGIVALCEAECLNPNRLPALVIGMPDQHGEFVPLPNPTPGAPDDVCGAARLYQHLGLQTDYSAAGKGILSPRMIRLMLELARQNAGVPA